MIKRTLQIALFVSLLPVAFPASRRSNAMLLERIMPSFQPGEYEGCFKVEVLEAFWYGCSHCFRFEPLLTAWKRTRLTMLMLCGFRLFGTF